MRIEEFTASTWRGVGRPPCERAWLANAFVAKAVLGLTTTAALIERLTMDRALKRICGFALCKKLPSEATFSRAFDEFAQGGASQNVSMRRLSRSTWGFNLSDTSAATVPQSLRANGQHKPACSAAGDEEKAWPSA